MNNRDPDNNSSNISWYCDNERKKDHKDDDDDRSIEEAQRLSFETVEVARNTLTACSNQSEQLENIDAMLDRQDRLIHQSTRKLRGMTWTGWIANKLTKSSKSYSQQHHHPSQNKDIQQDLLSLSSNANLYENVPAKLNPLAQAITNYHCNILILQSCLNDSTKQRQQLQGCKDICNALYDKVNQEYFKVERTITAHPLLESKGEKKWFMQLKQDHEHIRKIYEQLIAQTTTTTKININSNGDINSEGHEHHSNHQKIQSKNLILEGEMLLQSASRDSNASMESKIYKQEEHLSILSNNLEDLKDMSHELNESITHQNTLLGSFEDKAENLADNTNLLIRKSNSMINRTSWKSQKKQFLNWVLIQHIQSKKYITIKDNGSVMLSSTYDSDASVFGMWKKYSNSSSSKVIGLQNRLNRKWLGQTMISGSISCTSSSCGYRDEWEKDNDNDTKTKILCVCANWGNGGWIHVVPYNKDMILSADGYNLESKKKAAFWSFLVVDS